MTAGDRLNNLTDYSDALSGVGRQAELGGVVGLVIGLQ